MVSLRAAVAVGEEGFAEGFLGFVGVAAAGGGAASAIDAIWASALDGLEAVLAEGCEVDEEVDGVGQAVG